jgi:uroporphyrin-III C-methyltransferase
MNEETMNGIVYLVGAGPGDPDLITVRGAKCMQQAQVVLYDRLVNPALLELAPPWAELIYVGKAPSRHRLSQDEINTLLVEKASQGWTVIRLKGGDPFVFGRGGEEAAVLANAGIRFEIVPGISSALAVPAYAGIPVTQRHMAQSFTVVTGHTSDPDDPYGTDWDDLPTKGTLVILMGMRHLSQITQRLIEAGRDPATPAATIRQGTTHQQTVVTGRLDTIAHLSRGIDPPAIVVIGEVVEMQQQIEWYRPAVFAPDFSPGNRVSDVHLQTATVRHFDG